MGRGLISKLIVICLLVFCASTVKAQQDSGNISGTVSDEKGAVIAGANVTVTNDKTGHKRTTTSKSNGQFNVVLLPVGTYTVRIEAKGFKTAEHKEIDVHVAEEKVLPTVLEVGQVSETVEVQGGATQVELTTGEVTSLIRSEQVKELPLNGRSFVQLTLLVPGASVSDSTRTGNTGLLAGVDISMSGNPANSNAWLVDGVDNVDHGSGRTILVYPSIDSIEEFKVQSNSYSPEMSAAGGAQINLVTKSGTNEFHGSGYFFIRNDALNATNFFLNRAGAPKQILDYKNFGYTIGGPVKKDKVFFFWSQEWRRESRGVPRKSTVPTLLERQGDFSGPHSGNYPTPIDPFTGQPFPGNKIPANKLSPAGLALMKLWPEPTNSNLIDNWVDAPETKIPTWQIQGRADWNINAKNTLMFRYTQDSWHNPAPNFAEEGGLWGDTGFPTVDSSWDQPSKNIASRLTTTFGGTMVNQFQFSYANNRINITNGLGADINNDINSKIPEVFPGPEGRPHAIFWGSPLPGKGANLWNIAPWENGQDLWIWKDDFSKTHREHTFKVGVLYSTNKKDEESCCSDAPQFWGPTAVPGGAGVGGGWGDPNAPGNGGVVTGNGVADLLLKGTYWGGADEQSFVPTSRVRWRDYEAYATDTWRARPGLTLTLGLRFSRLPQTWQSDNLMGNFVLSVYDPKKGNDPLNGLIFPKDLKLPDKGIPGGDANLHGIDVGRALRDNHNNWSPRIGIAWDPTGKGKWAIRAGAGSFFGRSDLSNPVGAMIGNPPFAAHIDWGAGRPLDTIPGAPPGGTLGTATSAADLKSKTMGSYQWNVSVEHELMHNTTLQVGYIGNHGHHLPINWDLNYVPTALRAQFQKEALDPNNPNGEEDQLRALFPLKGSGALRYQTFAGDSSYNALQVALVKRFSNNFSYQLSYSWSKLLALSDLNCCGGGDNTRVTDPEHLAYDKGLASFDRTNILSMNAVYKLPMFSNYKPAVRHIIGGWEATGIYQYATGVPLTVNGGVAIGGLVNRPDLVADSEGRHTAENWINTHAYLLPSGLGQLGYSPKGSVRAPGINNVDLAFYRNFKLPREGMSLQFRAEFFNALNHTQFLGIDTAFNTGSGTNQSGQSVGGPLINPLTGGVSCQILSNGNGTGKYTQDCNINPTFGQASRARDPREIQFGIKFNF